MRDRLRANPQIHGAGSRSILSATVAVAIGFSLLAVAAQAAAGNSDSSGKKLDWPTCLNLAIEHNPELKAAHASTQEAQRLSRAAFGEYLPQVSASAGGTRVHSQGVAGAATAVSDSFHTTLNLTQNIFNGFGDQARIEQAKANEIALQATLGATKAKISQQLKSAFARLIFANDLLALSESIIKRRENNLALVKLRFEGGRENKGSLLLSQAYLSDANLTRHQAEAAIVDAKSELASAIGIEPAEIQTVVGSAPTDSSNREASDVARLLSETPEHRQAVAKEERSRAGIVVARSALMPALNLTASFGKLDSSWFPQGDRWQVGLTLTAPLFLDPKSQAVEAAQANLYASASAREAVDRQLVARLTQTQNAYNLAIEKEAVDKTFLSAARTRAEIARHKYNNGLLSFEEWDIIENDLINRERNVLNSRRDRAISEANWEQIQGKGAIP